ncbi:hypothetical protein AB0B85_06460 [Micromonospora sp. NPDC049044]|uniref:hypothetical protein n=1 Tax=unclassified Micromonospora TaxID=2617518 RepID=UPI0033C58940
MLPVALTCPLWWVARLTTRVLTSLAVVAALALGAGPASAAAPTSHPGVTSSVTAGSHPSAASSVRVVSGAGAAEEALPAWSLDAQPTLPEGLGAAATAALPVRLAGPDRRSLVDASSGRTPRGPPGR